MKSILVLALLAAAPAMALTAGENENTLTVTYISWCEGDSLVSLNNDGKAAIRANCSEQGLTCEASESYRGQGLIVSAACVQK